MLNFNIPQKIPPHFILPGFHQSIAAEFAGSNALDQYLYLIGYLVGGHCLTDEYRYLPLPRVVSCFPSHPLAFISDKTDKI